MRKTNRRPRFWYHKDDPYFPTLIDEFRRASDKGYSCVEISRHLDQSMRNIYGLMRSEGIIPKMQRKRQKSYNIPERLTKILQRCNIGFLQWCNTHSLEPEVTSISLLSEENPAEPSSVAAHRALRQDFPKAYDKIMDAETEYSTTRQPKIDQLKTDYTVTIALNPENNCYVAYVHEIDHCRVEAPTRIDAFFKLQSRYIIISSINKLRMLPSKR